MNLQWEAKEPEDGILMGDMVVVVLLWSEVLMCSQVPHKIASPPFSIVKQEYKSFTIFITQAGLPKFTMKSLLISQRTVGAPLPQEALYFHLIIE